MKNFIVNAILGIIIILIIFYIVEPVKETRSQSPCPLTVWDGDAILTDDQYEFLHTSFFSEHSHAWALEFLPILDHFVKDSIYWRAIARATADSGSGMAIIELTEEGATPEAALDELMASMGEVTDTFYIHK